MCVEEILDEFNERHEEFGIMKESDIVSVAAMPPVMDTKVVAEGGGVADPKLEVMIIYWSND